MGLLDQNQLAKMSHSDLYQMRFQQPDKQDLLSPYEHRAFAREWATENPVMAGLSLPFAIPAYALYKSAGFGNSRSNPGIDQVIQAYKGLGEGLLGHFK